MDVAPLMLLRGFYRLIRAIVKGKPEAPSVARRLTTSSREREWRPAIPHHWSTKVSGPELPNRED